LDIIIKPTLCTLKIQQHYCTNIMDISFLIDFIFLSQRFARVVGILPLASQAHICNHCLVGWQYQTMFLQRLEPRSFKSTEKFIQSHRNCYRISFFGRVVLHILVLTDDYSRKSWVYFLHNKDQIFFFFSDFFTNIQSHDRS